MLGNSHARFLGGDPAARPVSYPVFKKIDRDRLMTVKYFVGLKIRMKKKKTEQQEVDKWSLVTYGM